MGSKYSSGQKWNSLTLVSDILGGSNFKSTAKSVFKCDCGLDHFATLNNVTRGVVKHCSACSSRAKSRRVSTHKSSYSYRESRPLEHSAYARWQAIKRRCNNIQDSAYNRYGGRGISVCDRWAESYDNFLLDMGLPPTKDHQIDRIDNDGDYEPSNCRWVTRTENARNKSSNRNITAFGQTKTLTEWANEVGVKRETIARRLKSGSSPEDALSTKMKLPGKVRRISTPFGEFESISECSRKNGKSISGLHNRIKSDSFPDWHYL